MIIHGEFSKNSMQLLALPLATCVTLGKLFNFSKTWLPHLKVGNTKIPLVGLLGGLNKIKHVTWLA